MVELEEGIRRITFPLPFALDHVHCYLLRTRGGYTLVDTGLGTRDPAARWLPLLDGLDAPLERVVVTHMHPDHVGGAGDVAALTGVPVVQGREDFAQCVDAWGPSRLPGRLAAHWLANGMPAAEVENVVEDSTRLAQAIHWAESPDLVDPGADIDGWTVEMLRGHADGHIVLLRDGILIAGDTILSGITPTIGLYPNARPDPLGDYFETLDRIEQLAPRVAYTGHKDAIGDPAGRAREIRAHHEDRLAATIGALDGESRSAYDVSLVLFEQALSPVDRRFAVAESLAHLERLVGSGTALRADGGYVRA
jgi:glyoxylase-like metal-dependent hydrolase (beta-lactamase superfamily II)